MHNWFKSRWQAFQASYDADEAAAGSNPTGIIILLGALWGTVAILAYIPSVAASAQLKRPWVGIVLAGVAASTTFTAWKHRCRGSVGTTATLLDSALWSTAIIYCAVNTNGNYAIGLALANALAMLAVPAQAYSLTFLFGLTLVMGPATMMLLFRPPAATTLILWVTCVLALVTAHMTGERRRTLRRHKQLEQALGAADKVADESMQAALATMLLSLGHFLHELRNYQTAISTNLSYLEMTTDLDERAQEALQDAKQAQAAEQKLVYETIEALKQRSRPVLTTFPLREPLERAASEAMNVRVVLGQSDTGFVLNGNPEHLKLVLNNLIRNAAQAGASEVHLDVNLEPSGHSVRLLVHDDGPGISISRRDALFEPFGSSTKIEGTGLGLYLCRRHLGLFGGTVAVEEGPLGGAAFVIRLPGSVEKRESLMNDRSQSSPAA